MVTCHVFKPDPFGHRDICDAKVDEGDGKARLCGYKRSEHEIPQEAMKRGEGTLRHVEPAQVPTPGSFAGLENREEVIAKPCTLPETWRVDSAGASVRFCRPHETLTFSAKTARALAAALVAAAEEVEAQPNG